MARSTRVLIVDDSALIRQMLTRALSMDPRVEIVGTAKTGVEAIERARELSPDVITLDIEMPELSGLEALPHIRKNCDARVVMLSSLDDPDTTYRAMALGAIDFIPKPSAGMATSINELTEDLLKKIRIASRIVPARAEAAFNEIAAPQPAPPVEGSRAPAPGGPAQVCVAIASSTGGPPVLERVFSGILASMPAAYVIVQHLPAGFSASLARRLSAASEVHVSEVKGDEILEPGRAYLAPHGQHVEVTKHRDGHKLIFTEGAPLHGVRPAADPLMTSVARTFGERSVAVVLTGMGADGAYGATKVREAGGEAIVQDENTSVVWGMPGSALRAGAASRVVPAGLVAAEIRRAVRARTDREAHA